MCVCLTHSAKSSGTTLAICKGLGTIPAELAQHRSHPKWAATVKHMWLSGWLTARGHSGCKGPAQRHAGLPEQLCAIAPLLASLPLLQPASHDCKVSYHKVRSVRNCRHNYSLAFLQSQVSSSTPCCCDLALRQHSMCSYLAR